MYNVISAATASPHLLTPRFTIDPAQDRMGCATSSQTSAVDATRPSAKPEESNGASATGKAQSFTFVCNVINMSMRYVKNTTNVLNAVCS